jgi:hypothetical protein
MPPRKRVKGGELESTPSYTEKVPPPQEVGVMAIRDSVLLTVNKQPEGRVTARLLCTTGKS